MKKIYSIVISSLLCTPYVFGMETAPIIIRPAVSFPEEIENKILFYAAENAYKYCPSTTYWDKDMLNLKSFIYSISYVKKKCYEHINDSITTHTIINNFIYGYKNKKKSRVELAHVLATPGAKNYTIYSKLLHKFSSNILTQMECAYLIKMGKTEQEVAELENLTIDIHTITDLVKKGADVNYHYNTHGKNSLIFRKIDDYYRPNKSNEEKVALLKQVELLFELGAETKENLSTFLNNAIACNDPEIMQLLCAHNEKIEDKSDNLFAQSTLRRVIKNRTFPIDFLRPCDIDANDQIIEVLLKNRCYTLEEALRIAVVELNKDMVEKFILKGADLRKIDFSWLVQYILNSHIHLHHQFELFKTPTGLCSEEKKTITCDILALLCAHGADTTKGLAIMEDVTQHVDMVTKILQGNNL